MELRSMTANSVSVGILGATGYTGIELLRLLHGHPFARVDCMTSERHAGQPLAAVFPHLHGGDLPTLSKIGDLDLGGLDAVFGCLPHGTTQDVIRELPRGPKVIDLSADFRLRDPKVYERTYGQPHRATLRQQDAVYGLTDAAGRPVSVTFTPHLVPMNRGILATIYVRLTPGVDVQAVQAELERSYEGEPFARVLPFRSLPSTRHVRSTNACPMAVHPGRTPDRAILLSVTDNLVKGASGQALQNMNLMLGLPETAGLGQAPL